MISLSDVAVVGGGPAGLYAALSLARGGQRVSVFEEHGEIGEPVHCTGVLARDAFEEFGVDPDATLNELTTVRFFGPSGGTIAYSTPTVEAVVIDRARFDQSLAAQAMQAGVRVVRHRVMSLDVGSGGVTLLAGGSSFRARACLLACGASYALQRRLGLGMPRLLLQSAQCELASDRIGDVEVHLGEEIAPRGFGWAVPVVRGHRSCVRVGVMCTRDAGRYFARLLDRISRRWGTRASAAGAPRQKVLPLGPIGRTYTDRLLVVGDAAGLVKPTTGGGIYYSLVSAKLACETLLDALRRDALDAFTLSGYEAGWRKRLGPELRWQLLLRRLAQRLTDADIDAILELARTDGLMPLVRQTAAFNHHRPFIISLLKHPPARRVLFKAALA